MPQPTLARTKCIELAQSLVNDFYDKTCSRSMNEAIIGGDNTGYTAPTDNRKAQINSIADTLFTWYTGKADLEAALQILETSYNLADDIWQKRVHNRVYANVYPLSTDGSVEDGIVETRTSYVLPTDNRVVDTLEIAEARYLYIQTGTTA